MVRLARGRASATPVGRRRRVRGVRGVRGLGAFGGRWQGPVLTRALVLSNLLLFLITLVQSRSVWSVRVTVGQLWGREGVWASGATWGPPIAEDGEWWRLISGAFLHANLLHVGFNMLLLWLLGRELEQMLGTSRFGLIYLIALLAGSFGALFHYPDAPTVGASGGVFGLMGSAVVVQKASGGRIRDSGILGLLVLNLITTFTFPNISIGGHIGGLLGGGLASWVLFRQQRFTSRAHRALRLAVAAGIITGLVFAGMWAASTWRNPVF